MGCRLARQVEIKLRLTEVPNKCSGSSAVIRSKFLTKQLRDLTRKDSEWTSQRNALESLKKAVSSAPVLRYYNLEDEVTLQCDASQSGLGAQDVAGMLK